MTIPPFTGDTTHSLYRRHPDSNSVRPVNLWRTTGWITSPAVCLENLETGERMTVVIGSLQADEFVRLVPEVTKP